MNVKAHNRPRFNPAYKGKNGFFDRATSTSKTDEDMMDVDGRDDATEKLGSKRDEAGRIINLIESHRKVDEVLEGRGSYFPGMDAVRAAVAEEDTAARIKQRIDASQAQFHEQMDTIYDRIAEDYLGEVTDAYYSLDDSFSIPEIEAFYEKMRRSDEPTLSPFYSLISEVRYAHYRTLQDLLRHHILRRANEEAARKARDAQFPADVAAYHSIVNKDVQLRVARFLTMPDTTSKERMLSEFNWAWRQVEPLQNEYRHNESFRAEIQARIRELEVRDPRRKI